MCNMRLILTLVFLALTHPIFSIAPVSETKIEDGLIFRTYRLQEPHTTVYTIEIDPSVITIRPVHAFNHCFGLEKTSDIAKRTGASVAINAGFFEVEGLLQGRAAGALKIDGEWYSLPHKPRAAVMWDEADMTPIFDRITVDGYLTAQETKLRIDDINCVRRESQLILYTPHFHTSTLTHPGGIEGIIENGKLSRIGQYNDLMIPRNGFVVSCGKYGPKNALLSLEPSGIDYSIEVNPIIDKKTPTLLQKWKNAQHIIGGTPLLIKNGECISAFEKELVRESFLTSRHPRTALGTLENGHWVFVVADGRSELSRNGLTMKELQTFMLDIGCLHAMNLDGGGSSTMVVHNQVINIPSGGLYDDIDKSALEEIPISDALICLPKSSKLLD